MFVDFNAAFLCWKDIYLRTKSDTGVEERKNFLIKKWETKKPRNFLVLNTKSRMIYKIFFSPFHVRRVTGKHKKILSAEVSHGKLFIDLDMP